MPCKWNLDLLLYTTTATPPSRRDTLIKLFRLCVSHWLLRGVLHW